MGKIKLCIIDDQGKEIDELIEKIEENGLLELVDISEENCLAADTTDEGTGVKYTHEQQRDNVIQYIKKQWDKFDVLLIDLSLFGSEDEKKPISVEVLNALLKEKTYKDPVINQEKYIIIITGKGSANLDSKLKNTDLNNRVFSIHKPSQEKRVDDIKKSSSPCSSECPQKTLIDDIEKSSCPCPPGCLSDTDFCQHYKAREICNRNDCLFGIIKAIHKMMEDKG